MKPFKVGKKRVDPRIVRKVEKLLAGLGGCSYSVAKSLQAMNIKGDRNNCFKCPIANFLLQYFSRVDVGHHFCLVEHEGVRYRVKTPYPVSMFISRFDNGHFAYWGPADARVNSES